MRPLNCQHQTSNRFRRVSTAGDSTSVETHLTVNRRRPDDKAYPGKEPTYGGKKEPYKVMLVTKVGSATVYQKDDANPV